MDTRSKLLFAVFALGLVVAITLRYQAVVGQQDFFIYDYVECDPELQSCFDYCEDDECSEEYYAKIEKHAGSVVACHPLNEECEPLICEPGESECSIHYCSVDTLEDGEICVGPGFIETEESEEGEEESESDPEDADTEEAV